MVELDLMINVMLEIDLYYLKFADWNVTSPIK